MGHAPVVDKVRRVAAALAAAASVSTVVGSALPLFRASLDADDSTMDVTVTPWTIEVVNGYTFGGAPENGYPLVFVAVLLAFAAFWCRAAGRPGARQRTVRVAQVATTAGGAFLACAAWMVLLQVRYWDASFSPQEIDVGIQVGGETSYLAGLWVLVAAGLLGVAAAVFVWLPGTPVAPVVAPEVDPDALTPPFGIALPLPPEEPVDEVDPLTGLPVGQEPPSVPEARDEPIVIPDAPPPEPPPGPAVPPVEDPLAEPRGD